MNKIKGHGYCSGAVDIGGTKIAVGIVGNDGKIIASDRFKTERDPEAAVKKIYDSLRYMCENARLDLVNVGISCAGPVDTERGTVNNPYTLPGWDGFELKKRISEVTAAPAFLENDANCALIGEVFLSNLKKKRVLMVSVGTGVGCAFWDGKELYRTGRGYHPELGHVLISSNRMPSVRCYCGHYNCVENLLSGTALHKRAQDAGFRDFGDLCETYFSGFHRQKSAAELFMRDIKAEMFSALWNYSLIFQPDNIVLAGGMASAYYNFFEDVYRSFMENTSERRDFIPEFKLGLSLQGVETALEGAALITGFIDN